jgi:hypothetical protein
MNFNFKYRTYLSGMAMATPFAAATLPYPLLFISLVISIPLVINVAKFGVHFPMARGVPAIIWVVLVIGLFHCYGLWIGPTPFGGRVLLDIAVVALVIGVFLVGQGRENDNTDLLKGFFTALIPFALTVSVFGLIKAALLERGYLLDFLLQIYPNQYPQGSSLRADYNLFSLSMLIACLGVVTKLFSTFSSRRKFFLQLFAISILYSTGLLAGSRRFLIISILVPLFWVIEGLMVFKKQQILKKVFLPMACVVCTVTLQIWLINSASIIQKYQILFHSKLLNESIKEDAANTNTKSSPSPTYLSESSNSSKDEIQTKYKIDSIFYKFEAIQKKNLQSAAIIKNINAPSSTGIASDSFRVSIADPLSILATLRFEDMFGFSSRVERWNVGSDLLFENGWLLGTGFSYHKVFSCRFFDCASFDYPHFPLMSEWLIGGILGEIAAIIFLIMVFWSIWQSGRKGWKSGSTVLILAVMPYSMLSGDTLFSIPQFIALCLLAQSQNMSTKHDENVTYPLCAATRE